MRKRKPELRFVVYGKRGKVYHVARRYHEMWFPICSHWGDPLRQMVMGKPPKDRYQMCKACAKTLKRYGWEV